MWRKIYFKEKKKRTVRGKERIRGRESIREREREKPRNRNRHDDVDGKSTFLDSSPFLKKWLLLRTSFFSLEKKNFNWIIFQWGRERENVRERERMLERERERFERKDSIQFIRHLIEWVSERGRERKKLKEKERKNERGRGRNRVYHEETVTRSFGAKKFFQSVWMMRVLLVTHFSLSLSLSLSWRVTKDECLERERGAREREREREQKNYLEDRKFGFWIKGTKEWLSWIFFFLSESNILILLSLLSPLSLSSLSLSSISLNIHLSLT